MKTAIIIIAVCEVIRTIQITLDIIFGKEISEEERKEDIEIYQDQLAALNMATKALEQEPKTGHWITQWNVVHQKEYYYCSECREEFSYDGETGIKMNDYNFCPACGAKMIEPKESEDQEPCDKCEVGNPCLYCKHEFDPQESEGEG